MDLDPSELMRRFIDEAFNRGNLAILDEIVHQEYRFRSPESEINGITELKHLIAGFRNGFPDLNLAIDEQLVDGDRVCTCLTLKGTHMDEFMHIPSSGQQVEVHAIVVSRFQDAQIIEEWELLDQLGLLTQLGVIPGE